MEKATAIWLYAALHEIATAIDAFADQSMGATNAATADPVSRRVICISSAMLANCVRKTQTRNGGDSRPKMEEKTRKNSRSLSVRTVPSACGLNKTWTRSEGELTSSRNPSQAKSSLKNHILSASQCTATQNSMGVP